MRRLLQMNPRGNILNAHQHRSYVTTTCSERAHAEVAVVRYASYNPAKVASSVRAIALRDGQKRDNWIRNGLTLSVTAL